MTNNSIAAVGHEIKITTTSLTNQPLFVTHTLSPTQLQLNPYQTPTPIFRKSHSYHTIPYSPPSPPKERGKKGKKNEKKSLKIFTTATPTPPATPVFAPFFLPSFPPQNLPIAKKNLPTLFMHEPQIPPSQK